MEFSDRVHNLELEGAYHMLARAQALEAQGREIIHLEIGQPDVPTFENISQAAIGAIRDGHTGYTPSAGISALRQVVAADAGMRRRGSISARTRSSSARVQNRPFSSPPWRW